MTALGYLLWFGGLAKVPASTAGVVTGVLPVSAVLRSNLILGEPFSWATRWASLASRWPYCSSRGSGRMPKSRSTALRNFLPVQPHLRVTGFASQVAGARPLGVAGRRVCGDHDQGEAGRTIDQCLTQTNLENEVSSK